MKEKSARKARLTPVQKFLRRGGFGMAPALRRRGEPPLRNAAFLIGFAMVAIELGLFLAWHLTRLPGFDQPYFGFIGANEWRNYALDHYALSLPEAFGLWPDPVLPSAPWVGQCLHWGPTEMAPAFRRPCTVLLQALAAAGDRGAEWWRLGTYVFLHGGLIHMALNLLAYMVFAPAIQRRCGSLRFAAFFLLCGVAGGLAHFALRSSYNDLLVLTGLGDASSGAAPLPLVGASGAIMGLWLACLRIQYDRLRRIPAARRPIAPPAYLKRIFINVLAINVLFMITRSFISGEAHLGGALAGFVLAPLFFTKGESLRRRARKYVHLGRWGLPDKSGR